MNDVMEETRTVVIRGKPEVFYGYVQLRERADGLLREMERLEAAMPADPLAAASRWSEIGELGDTLDEVIEAQHGWLADNDASLLQLVETFCRNFRAMRASNYTIGWEDI